MTQKITNPATPVPQTPALNDRDLLTDMLTVEKYITDAYSTAMNESSHSRLFEDVFSIFEESQRCQRDIFNTMFAYGWYSLEAVDAQKLQQTYQQFSGYMEQSPYQN
ncbi:spore coat protein [Paenalkalicoccus suaedae]|uniref:Spore coat protein n=1 Tax=Paenalkalicoccus suaedae TaxID=2592382 RepID=A0A859FHT0_9BACI|nr:spore coat protein [Paenalkalicoccus suaedae]QKS72224.1 spore coat protein [Paenalkalicoccus suaedae]